MTYIVDTHWTISFLNGREEAVALFAELQSEGIALSVITAGELLEGLAAVIPENAANAREVTRFLSESRVLNVDMRIAQRYGQIRAQLRSAGQLIPDNDIWIAATALAHDFTLVSRDRHFARVDGLSVQA